MIQIAFIMPTELQRHELARLRNSVVELRPDQYTHFVRLLRSWRIFGRYDGLPLVWKAVKRTLRDRP